MQDKILLGFLMNHKKLTSYEAMKFMELSTTYFYTTSLGSINPAFKKLLRDGDVTFHENNENGRYKKEYSITDKGKETFFNWMDEDIGVSKIKVDLLLKIFFFSHISNEHKSSLLDVYLVKVERHIKEMQGVVEYCNENKIEDEKFDTLLFGLDYYKFVYSWFKKYKKKFDK